MRISEAISFVGAMGIIWALGVVYGIRHEAGKCPHYLSYPQSDLHFLIPGNHDFVCKKVEHDSH